MLIGTLLSGSLRRVAVTTISCRDGFALAATPVAASSGAAASTTGAASPARIEVRTGIQCPAQRVRYALMSLFPVGRALAARCYDAMTAE